jgi:hypothetical protein
MRCRLAFVGLVSVLIITGCGSDASPDEDEYVPKTNQEKISDFNDCISGGLGGNPVEIKETIDNCSSANLNP